MAKKTVKRIKLSGGRAIVEEEPAQIADQSSVSAPSGKKPRRRLQAKGVVGVIISPYSYVKESWQELRQVRWPGRRATWSLTFAVIVFTLFFVLVILLLDAAFQFLFKEVLLK